MSPYIFRCIDRYGFLFPFAAFYLFLTTFAITQRYIFATCTFHSLPHSNVLPKSLILFAARSIACDLTLSPYRYCSLSLSCLSIASTYSIVENEAVLAISFSTAGNKTVSPLRMVMLSDVPQRMEQLPDVQIWITNESRLW